MFGRGRIKDGVSAQAKVLELGPTAKGARQTEKRNVDYRFRLEITVPGGAPYMVEHVEQMPVEKAPLLGDVIPVTVSASDPKELRIDWDSVPDIADRARASAAAARAGDAAGAAEALGFTLRDEQR
jgi:hypothetical protein